MICEKSADLIRKISTGLIMAAAFFACFQSGSIRWQHCILPIIFLCAAVIINKFKSSGIVSDALLLVSLASCVASVFFAKTDMQEGFHEAFKYLCFAAAFYAAASLPEDKIFKAISAVGVAIAFCGLLSYCNIIRASELVFNDRGILRLQSFIRYANVTAVILGCSYLALCGIKFKSRILSGALKMLVLSAFYLTVSKAAIPIFIVIGILMAAKNKDADFTVHNAVSIIFFIPAILLVRYGMFAQCLLLIILWITAGSVLSGKLSYSRKITIIWLLAISLAAIGAILLMVLGKYDIFSTFTFRLKYMKDALKLLPGGIFGNGPASWKFMQYTVQSEQYNVAYIHNGWLQFLVEYGAIFFVSFTGVVIISAYRMLKSKAYTRLAMLTFFAVHAFIDIEFGFASALIILGLLCGMPGKPLRINILPVITMLICLVFTGYSTAEFFTRLSFEKAYTAQASDKALQHAYSLEKLCPGDSSLQLGIATLSARDVKIRIEKAMELNPYDTAPVIRYAQYKISNSEKDVIPVLNRIIDMTPMQEDVYTTVKQLAQQAYIYGSVTEEGYGEFLENTDSAMKAYGVTDRNKQLKDISNTN